MSDDAGVGRTAGDTERRLLQQELIDLRSLLDRQVTHMTRLNRLSNELIAGSAERSVADIFAEAIVDVLDVAVGAVWILDERRPAMDRFSVFGVPGSDRWTTFGSQLATAIDRRGKGGAVDLAELGVEPDPELRLVETIVGVAIGRSGAVDAILLAADSPTTAGMTQPVTEDSVGILAALAEKCAAELDGRADRTVIQQQLTRLRESEERLELVLQGANDGWFDWDLDRDECLVSARWLEMLGRPHERAQIIQGFWHHLVHDDEQAAFEYQLAQTLASDSGTLEAELRLRRTDDDYLTVLVRGVVLRVDGVPTRFAGSILDLTERKRYEAAIHRLAYYDPLTDLPNRRLLADRLRQALTDSATTGDHIAVLMLDLDRFKSLNDTHGHAAGDELLRAVSWRLQSLLHYTDTIARLSGDEFVVVLQRLGTDAGAARAAATEVAHQIQAAFNEPYELSVGTLHYSASIGVAISDHTESSSETLLKQVDVALYQAKASGRNVVRTFETSMQVAVDTRSELEARLRAGLARDDEFAVVYQPQVDRDGRLTGAEALLRWYPTGGEEIDPDTFIPVAEETGVIHHLGQLVLETVCRQLVDWRDELPPGFRLAVNLSASEFLHPDLPSRVLATIDRHGVAGEHLRLEITEATVLADLEFAAARMDLLRSRGVDFSLDDFGTGYSSLTYLRQLPLSEVKIDRSYVTPMLDVPEDAAIVRSVLVLCDALGIPVTAEGVETAHQRDFLLAEGCHSFQGLLFGQPIRPPAGAADLLAAADRSP